MADNYAASTATTGVLSVGTSVTSNIDTASDDDWFRITLTTGRAYQFDLAGSATVIEPSVHVMDSAGNSLVGNTGFGSNAQVTFAPTATRTYYLSARSLSDSETGAYTLSAADIGPTTDIYAASTATTGALAVGNSVTSNIDTMTDADWLRITLTAGRTYQFDLVGSLTVLEPFLHVIDNAGNSLVGDAGFESNAQVIFAPTTTGTYYLSARSMNDNETGGYTLSAADIGAATDIYAASTATTGP